MKILKHRYKLIIIIMTLKKIQSTSLWTILTFDYINLNLCISHVEIISLIISRLNHFDKKTLLWIFLDKYYKLI
jgi:hypothetical protein